MRRLLDHPAALELPPEVAVGSCGLVQPEHIGARAEALPEQQHVRLLLGPQQLEREHARLSATQLVGERREQPHDLRCASAPAPQARE